MKHRPVRPLPILAMAACFMGPVDVRSQGAAEIPPPTSLENGPRGERSLMLRDPDGLRVRLDPIAAPSTVPDAPPPPAP